MFWNKYKNIGYFRIKYVVDDCTPERCNKTGECSFDGDVYKCGCGNGYTGQHCDIGKIALHF